MNTNCAVQFFLCWEGEHDSFTWKQKEIGFHVVPKLVKVFVFVCGGGISTFVVGHCPAEGSSPGTVCMCASVWVPVLPKSVILICLKSFILSISL